MKNYRNKIYRHVTGIFLMIVIGILVPSLLQEKHQTIIQIILVSVLISIYTLFIYKKNIFTLGYASKDHQQERMVESQKIMLALSNSMIQVKSFEELLNIILVKAVEMIPTASQGSILVMNKEGKLEFKAILGFDEELYKVKLEPEESYQWKATGGVFSGPIIIENLQKYSNESMSDESYDALNEIDALSFKSSLSAPIMINNLYFGSINLDSKMSNMFNEEDVQMMSYFANQATIAIVNHQLYEEMLHFSRYDGLTKIYNRRYFNELIEKKLTRKTSMNFSIVIIDLNKFKQINDLYGHRNGDYVLERFATFISEELSDMDVFARYGGDEFVCMISNKDYKYTDELMAKILELSSKNSIDLIDIEASIECGFAYGIATYPNDGPSLNELLHVADSRMYENKKSHHKRRHDDK